MRGLDIQDASYSNGIDDGGDADDPKLFLELDFHKTAE
jgi:hypothetical protein